VKRRMALLLGAILLLAACGSEKAEAPAERWTVKGRIVAVDPVNKYVTIDHEEIPGLMAAMTMPFPVEDVRIMEGLAEGDAVEFVLTRKPSGVTITRITKVNASALAPAAPREFTARGRVVVVNAATYSIMVENEEVPGVLTAERRVFGVNPPSLLEGLKEGDRIEFTLTRRESGALVITRLRRLPE